MEAGGQQDEPAAKRARVEGDDVEEGEAPDDDDENDDAEDDKYGEDLIGDEQDRQFLAGLPEVERERILSERYEKRKKREERDFLAKGRSASRPGASAAGGAGDRNAAARRGSTRASETRRAALDDIRKKRDKETTVGGAPRSARGDEELETMTPSPDRSDDESHQRPTRHPGSSSSATRGASSSGDQEDDPDKLTIEGARILQVTRTMLLTLNDFPDLSKLLCDTMVRVGLGKNPKDQSPTYRVAQIQGVVRTGVSYEIDTTGKKASITLKLKIPGGRERDMRCTYVSNTQITESEFSKFVRDAAQAKYTVVSQTQALDIRSKIEKKMTQKPSQKDIEAVVEENRCKRSKPVNIAAAKIQVKQRLDILEDRGSEQDRDEITELRAQLQQWEDLAAGQGEYEGHGGEDENQRATALDVAQINERHRRKNYELQRKAEIAQSRSQNSENNVFARIKTEPRLLVPGAKVKPDPKADEAKEKEEKEKEEKAKQEKAAKSASPPLVVVPPDVTDLLKKAHDFDVPMDDSVPVPAVVSGNAALRVDAVAVLPTPPSLSPPVESAQACPTGTRKLTLAEYMRQRKTAVNS